MDKMTGSDFHDYVVRTFKRTDKTTEVYDAITDTIVDMCERMDFEDTKVEAYTTAGITTLGDYKIDLPLTTYHVPAALAIYKKFSYL